MPRSVVCCAAVKRSAQIKNAVNNFFTACLKYSRHAYARSGGRELIRWCAEIVQGWFHSRFSDEAHLRELQAVIIYAQK